MDWALLGEALRYGMRPFGLFIWAFFAVLLTILFWPYSGAFVAVVVPWLLVRAWKNYCRQVEAGVSKLPPLCREDWRRARSKLKKIKV